MKNRNTAEKIEELAEKYFESRKIPRRTKNGDIALLPSGEPDTEEKPYTISGLALALGFSRREELFAVTDKKAKEVIDRALLRIEEKAEEKLFDKESLSGTKLFLAANFSRWKESAEIASEPCDLGVFSVWAK